MSSIITEVTNYLNKLLHFFEPVQLLANSHFASLFSENVWSEHVPKSIQEELSKTNSLNDFTEFYMEILKSRGPTEFARNHPTLTCFLQEAFDLSISSGKNHLSSLVSLEDLFSDKGISAGTDFSSTEFMSEKKLHEVKASAKVTAFLSDLTKSSHVIDVGGGKGYLSCVLVLHHSHKVLGLDASQLKTCGAEKMSEKLAKQWTELGLDEGNLKSRNGGKNWRLEFLKNRYKLAMTYVTPRTNVKKIVEDNFGDKVGGLTLTGLHTCGDLSPTCLRMFLNNDNITSMLNVGCCYHLIREMFSGEKADSLTRDEEMGFPLSTFLRQKKFSLGRNARMLASYSLDRINSRSNVDEVAFKSLFYRAVLDVFIKSKRKNLPVRRPVGKLATKCKNFHEYLLKAIDILNMNVEVTEKDSDLLYETYVKKEQIFRAFFLLRVSLAPIVESIILLDRFLYLIENGVSQAYIVKLFDLEISPRGFGIVAWKDSERK